MSSANVWCMCADESSPHVSPFTRTDIRAFVPSSSSAVTMQGPRTFEPSQSLALAGPMPTGSSRTWVSRADMSFQIVHPKTYARASSARMSFPDLPITAAISSS